MPAKTFFKRYPKLAIILFNLFFLFFIFIVFEILLRIFTPSWLSYTMNYLKTGNGFGNGSDANWKVKYKDGKFYSFAPNSTFKIFHQEYENTVHINNLGGRCTKPNEQADTAKIIPFIGDSFVIGVGVEDTENMVAQCKNLLNYNFLNLGISGTCMPIQRKIVYNRLEELGHPSQVIFGFFLGNDFNDIKNEKLKKSDSNQLLKSNSESKGFMWKLNYSISHNNILKRLYTLQFIKQKILNIKNKNKDKEMANWDPIFYMMYTLDSQYINEAKINVDNEVKLLSEEPYKSIVLIIPDKYQINDSIRKQKASYYNIDEKYLDPFLPNQIIIAALNKYKIKYVDASSCMMDHINQGNLYYNQDNHFTKLGQKIFSECVASKLKEIIN